MELKKYMKKLKNKIELCATLIVAAIFLVQPSQIFALTISGGVNSDGVFKDIIQIAPPPDATWEALESSDHVFFWAEQSGVLLNSPLSVDVINPSLNIEADIAGPDWWKYDSGVATKEAKWNGDLGPGVYDSFFLHADKQGANERFAGSLTFDNTIQAIIYKNPRLFNTDAIFGAPGTLYPPNGGSATRMYELDSPNNWFRVSADGLTLEYETYVIHDLDQMRIITGSSALVPEPATMLLFGIGLIGLAGVGRKNHSKINP